MRLLTISGSLRAASHNTALLRAAAELAPDGVEVQMFEGLDRLPLPSASPAPPPVNHDNLRGPGYYAEGEVQG